MSDCRMDSKEDAEIQEYDDRFYENIEAPKFVDFTAPDRSLPDETSWFCARIGCDQKHEVVDPDALYKSFLLRVMAARSPNIRLQKTLNRKDPSAIGKCPHSAPAKSARDRIPRLAMITSISQKDRENRVKVSLLSKLNSTPSNGKVKKFSIQEKASTTPRRKKCPSSPMSFRSVQKPKVTLTMPKTNSTAKALIFHTPKKNEKIASFKCQKIPTPDVCSEMKKLAISSPSKLNPSSKNTARNLNSSLSASSPAKSQLPASNCKNKVSSVSRGCKGREVPSKYLKNLVKPSPKKCNGPMQQEADNECSDMEVDGKSRSSSMEACLISERHEVSLEDTNSSNLGVSSTTKEEESLTSSVESSSKEKVLSKSGKNGAVPDDDREEWTGTEDKLFLSEDLPIAEKSLPVSKDPQGNNKIIPTLSVILEEGELTQCADVTLEENDQSSNAIHQTEEPIDTADKENESGSDENRDVNISEHHSKSKVGSLKGPEDPLKKVDTSKTTIGSAPTNGAQGGKYKKAKPTNPKPFRLRTDERGILKEANLERRLQVLALKETVPSSKFPNGNLQKRKPAHNEQNQKTSGWCRSNTQEISLNDLERPEHETSLQMRPTCRQTARSSDSRTALRSPQIRKKLKEEKEKVTKETQIRSPRSSSLQSQLVGHGRSAASPGKLAMIKEASQEEEIAKNGNTMGTSAGRSVSRGKRPTTVPKEPIFHKIHTPKNCTKKPGKAIS